MTTIWMVAFRIIEDLSKESEQIDEERIGRMMNRMRNPGF
jgi:hypothetical protein